MQYMQQSIVTVTQNKPFSIWFNLICVHWCCSLKFNDTVRKIKTFLIYSQPEECS